MNHEPRNIVRVQLGQGPGYFKFRCFACGEIGSDSPVRANIYDTPWVADFLCGICEGDFYVCEECVKAGPTGIKGRLAARINALQEQAYYLERYYHATWELPTYAEYEKANDKFNEELRIELEGA